MMKFANQEKGKFFEVEPNEYFFIWLDFDCLTCFFVVFFSRLVDLQNWVNFNLLHLNWFQKSSQLNTSSFGLIWLLSQQNWFHFHFILDFISYFSSTFFLFLGKTKDTTRNESKNHYVQYQMSLWQFLMILIVNQLIIFWINFSINLSLQFMKNQFWNLNLKCQRSSQSIAKFASDAHWNWMSTKTTFVRCA